MIPGGCFLHKEERVGLIFEKDAMDFMINRVLFIMVHGDSKLQDGVRDKKIAGAKVPLEFDLMIYADSPQYRTIATIISVNFRKIGVDISITPTKWAIMLQKLNKKEFDACILGWGSEWRGDPYQLWHSSQADEPDSSNFIS